MNTTTAKGATPPLGTTPQDIWTSLFSVQVHLMETIIQNNLSALGFLRERAERDLAFLTAVSKARTPIEAFELWQSFGQKMFVDYSVEADRAAAAASEVATEAVMGATPETTAQ